VLLRLLPLLSQIPYLNVLLKGRLRLAIIEHVHDLISLSPDLAMESLMLPSGHLAIHEDLGGIPIKEVLLILLTVQSHHVLRASVFLIIEPLQSLIVQQSIHGSKLLHVEVVTILLWHVWEHEELRVNLSLGQLSLGEVSLDDLIINVYDCIINDLPLS
jgi:hypothetical protein